MSVTKQLMGLINFNSPPPHPMEVNGACAFLVAHILQNIFFCVQLKKKMDRIFIFG